MSIKRQILPAVACNRDNCLKQLIRIYARDLKFDSNSDRSYLHNLHILMSDRWSGTWDRLGFSKTVCLSSTALSFGNTSGITGSCFETWSPPSSIIFWIFVRAYTRSVVVFCAMCVKAHRLYQQYTCAIVVLTKKKKIRTSKIGP